MLLPYPAKVRPGTAKLRFTGRVEVTFGAVRSDRLERAVARFQSGLQRIAGVPDPAEVVTIPLRIDCQSAAAAVPQLGDAEGYRLSVAAGGVVVFAESEWGVLHGLNTLLQLVEESAESDVYEIRCCEIVDQPRFPWRGVLIDVARHFIDIESLQRTLDGLALCKLNVLHLHLSDDQAFRFPSVEFPGLNSDEHFTHAELVDLVKYAADRGVRVVPEIDMPGHCSCWLQAYPQWGTGQAAGSRHFGVHQACLDPTSEALYSALELLLAEVASVFPDRYLHIGGDEVHPAWWSQDPGVQNFMADRSIPDVATLQAYFITRVTGIVDGLGRTAMAWDEVLHPDLPDSLLVQSWRGATARDRALRQGNDCVVSANYYLDLFYPADVHYRFDPQADEATLLGLEDELLDDPRFAHVAPGMRWTHHWREPPGTGERTGNIVGAEACLWSELVAAPLLDVRLWSRLPALAERFWSAASVTDIDSLYLRLNVCFERLALVSDIDIMASSRELITQAGVSAEWWPLVDVLEPVKWYGRLLGEQALSARIAGNEMPQSRPYDADTSLTRVIDGLLPESMTARAVASLCESELAGERAAAVELGRFAESWQALAGQPGCLPELTESARLLQALGFMVVEVLAGRVDRTVALATLDAAAEPQGEYLIAVAPMLRAWLLAKAR